MQHAIESPAHFQLMLCLTSQLNVHASYWMLRTCIREKSIGAANRIVDKMEKHGVRHNAHTLLAYVCTARPSNMNPHKCALLEFMTNAAPMLTLTFVLTHTSAHSSHFH